MFDIICLTFFTCPGTTGRIAVATSRMSEISTAYLDLLEGNGTLLTSVPLEECRDFLVGSLAFPRTSIAYQLRGEDRDGNPFVYRTRQTDTFTSAYDLVVVGEENVEVEVSETATLTYTFYNRNSYGTAEIDFSVNPVEGLEISVHPRHSTVDAGKRIQVTVTVTASAVASYRVTLNAVDACGGSTSLSRTVTFTGAVS